MKNKISKYSFLFLLLLAVLLVSSCDFFTSSVLSFAARDTAETVKSTPTNALVSAGSNPSVVGDQNMAQTYLEELGNRPEDLENLKTEEAENVLFELSQQKGRMTTTSARITLERWQKGELHKDKNKN